MRQLIRFICVALVGSPLPAIAATVEFTGTAAATCALTQPVNGTLTLGADLQSWATATAGSITAVNTSAATLNVTAPTNWASAPGGTPATTFAVSGVMSGANSGALAGTSTARTGALTAIGTTVTAISLAATATAPYRTGVHTADVTVTCTTP